MNTDKRREIHRAYAITLRGKASKLLRDARYRAKKQGIRCTLTKEWVVDKLVVGRCEATNLEFTIKARVGKKTNAENPWAPSIDRIDPNGEYTPENSRLTIWIFNQAKGAFNEDDLVKMSRALLRYGS